MTASQITFPRNPNVIMSWTVLVQKIISEEYLCSTTAFLNFTSLQVQKKKRKSKNIYYSDIKEKNNLLKKQWKE